jgi:hypothetical protein
MADNDYINFPQLQGYGSRNRGSLSFKPLSFSELVEFVNPSSFFADQTQAAKDYNANAGNRNPLQYDIEGTELAGEEPTFSRLDQRMTYDPSDIDNVDYFGRPPSPGPDLSYRPEDLYPGEPTDTSFLGFLKRNYKDYIKGAAKAGLKAATKTDKAPKQPQPISSVRGGNISYAPTGRLGAGPYAPVNTRPDYQALAQNAFKTALVNYILKNPKANIQGML